MIGRQSELADATHHIALLTKGMVRECVIFVTGEAGIGKTTFLKAVVKACEGMAPAPVVALAECSTPIGGHDIGEVEALKPWVDAIDALMRGNSAQEKTKRSKFDFGKFLLDTAPAWIELIPVIGTSISAGVEIVGAGFDQIYMNRKLAKEHTSGALNQQQIFQQYINLLLKLSETGPLVLVLDDFHWADTSSCNLLFSAARQLQEQKILFIVAYRPDDAESSRGGEGHPVLHIRSELERYGLSRTIEIPKFSAENLDALLHYRYKNYQNNDTFEQWLARVGGGNALFITEFLNTLEEDGYIDRESGIFSDHYENVKVPPTAYAVVSERIRRMSEENRELLRYASVEGETFTSHVLSKITEIQLLKILQKLRLLEENHHAVRSLGKQRLYARESTAYQFEHTLLHRVMYETLGEEERELIHEAVLEILKDEWKEALQAGTNLAGIAARTAVHANIAGDPVFAAEILLQGARSSWREYSEDEAMQKLGHALRSLETVQEHNARSDIISGEVYFLKAEIHRHRARYSEAIEDYSRAENFFLKSNSVERVLDCKLGTASALWLQTDFLKTEELAGEVLKTAEEHKFLKQKAQALNLLGNIAWRAGETDVAFRNYEEVLKLQQQTGNAYGEAMALSNIGVTSAGRGRYDAALQNYENSLKILRAENLRQAQATLLNNIANVYAHTNDYEKARSFYEESLQICRTSGDRFGEAAFLNNIGSTFLYTGDSTTALKYYRQSLKIKQDIGDRRGEAESLFNIGDAFCQLENYEEAKEYLVRSAGLSEEIAYVFGRDRAKNLLKMIDERQA